MVLRLQSLQPTRRGYCETLPIQATQVLAFSYNACVQPRHTQTCRSEKGDVAQRARGCAAARESRIRRYVEYAIRFLRYGAIRNSNSVTQLFWNTRFNGKY
jgi:hypothetical protein